MSLYPALCETIRPMIRVSLPTPPIRVGRNQSEEQPEERPHERTRLTRPRQPMCRNIRCVCLGSIRRSAVFYRFLSLDPGQFGTLGPILARAGAAPLDRLDIACLARFLLDAQMGPDGRSRRWPSGRCRLLHGPRQTSSCRHPHRTSHLQATPRFWPSVSGGVANVTQNSIGVGGSLLLFLLVLRRCQAMGQELDRPR